MSRRPDLHLVHTNEDGGSSMPGHTTVWQDNAAAFATQADVAVDRERRAGVTAALGLIVMGRRGRGLYELVRSVERQARMAGVGSWELASWPAGCREGER